MIEWIDPSHEEIRPNVIACVPAEVAHQNLVLPLREEGETLVVAVEDPSDEELTQKLCFIVNRPIHVVGAPIAELKFAIWRFYGPPPEQPPAA